MATVKATPKTPAQPVQDVVETPQTAPVQATPLATINNASTALALPDDLAAELAAFAKEAAASERPSISKISLQAGQITYAGNPVPGNSLDVVVLSAAYRNVFYAGRFDSRNVVNPNCFSLSDKEDGMAPDAIVHEPEGEDCASCPKGQWKSDPNGGNGKACKQSRRLIIMPADAVGDVEAIRTGELAMLDLPVTSQKGYANLVNTLAADGTPPWAAVINIATVPDAKTQFKVVMTPISKITHVDSIRAIRARLTDAMRIALTPYDETATKESANKPAPAANKKF